MSSGREQPRRKHHRLRHFDYGSAGAYFITACTHKMQMIFGTVQHHVMCLNDLGSMVWEEWRRSFDLRPNFSSGAFIVMPNHWHAIIHIHRKPEDEWNASRIDVFGKRSNDTIAAMVGGMRMAVTSRAKKELGWDGRLWQRSSWDHVIRDTASYNTIEQYIYNNARHWGDDRFHPDNWVS